MSDVLTVFTEEEVKEASLKYFNDDELAADVFLKYALFDNKNNHYHELTPDDMFRRLAKEFARIEKKYPNPLDEEEIYSYLKDFKKIVAQGSPMSAVGNNFQYQTVGNCYVIKSPNDSYGSILRADQEIVQIAKRRGGVGTDISNIRPRGMSTNNAAKTTDGIGVFMERFSNSCREVAQNGRRGALMLSINCHHPEIETFINIKKDRKKVTGANISIRWTDEFMEAVEKNEMVQLRFPVEKDVPHKIEKWVNAKNIWDQFVDSAWDSAEPGCMFVDTIWRRGPSDMYPGWKSTSSNPCGEQNMNNDSCRLMLMNLYSFVENKFLSQAKFDFIAFDKAVQVGQRLMDDLVDIELEKIDRILAKIEKDPEPSVEKETELNLWTEFRKNCVDGRRTGLGITALGDTIAALGVRYGSEKSIEYTEEIYKALALGAYRSSVKLAEERGSFPIFDLELELGHPFIQQILNEDEELKENFIKFGRRNIAITTTAPAGSVSTETQTTSGIEPAFSLSYKRRRKVDKSKIEKADYVDESGDAWMEYMVYHKPFLEWKQITGLDDVKDSPYFQATANEIDAFMSVKQQAVAQKWICNAISRTVNLPSTATKEQVHEIYMEGWKSGCKGITIYRDGCRSGVLISTDEPTVEKKDKLVHHEAPKRPATLKCDIHRATIQGEKWIVLVGLFDDKPYEVFAGLSNKIELPKKYENGELVKHHKKTTRSSYDLSLGEGEDQILVKDIIAVFDNPNNATITRFISLALRHGSDVKFVVEQLQKDDTDDFTSFSKVVARTLKKYIKDGEKATRNKECPTCSSENLVYKEGCMSCENCGWSKCG